MNSITMIALGLAVVAPAVKEKEKKDESAAIVGKWSGLSSTTGGKLEQDFPMAEVTFEFTQKGKFKLAIKGQELPEGDYKLNTKSDLKELDFNIGGGDGNHKCIYNIEKDVLTICWDEKNDASGPRPVAFGSPAGTKMVLVIFKRIEEKKK